MLPALKFEASIFPPQSACTTVVVGTAENTASGKIIISHFFPSEIFLDSSINNRTTLALVSGSYYLRDRAGRQVSKEGTALLMVSIVLP